MPYNTSTPISSANSADPLVSTHSMAWVIEQIVADVRLTPTRRRNVASSIRRFCQALALDPIQAGADFAFFRERLQNFEPVQAKIRAKRWSTIRSDVTFALKRYSLSIKPKRSSALHSPEWRAVRTAARTASAAWSLLRFARYCDERRIVPADVNEDIFQAYCNDLRDATFKTKPERLHREACRLWNRLAASVPALGLNTVRLPSYRKTYTPRWQDLPAQIQEEADNWLQRMSQEGDLFDEEAPDKPLSPASIASYRYALRQIVGALSSSGHELATINSLNVLIDVDTAKQVLRFFYVRHGRKKSSNLARVAHVLVLIARTAVHADEAVINKLMTLSKRSAMTAHGLRPRPKAALRQFSAPDNIARILLLPERLFQRLQKKTSLTLADARLMQVAVALELLLMRPIRRKNLIALRIDHHLIQVGGQMQVSIPAAEVKNNVDLDYPLPQESTRLIAFYIDRLLPLFGDNPRGFLFPGQNMGQPKSAEQFGRIFRKVIKQETGLDFFPHLARHFGATLFLRENPEGVQIVQRVLAHKSMGTTIRSYASLEDEAAVKRFDDVVLHVKANIASELGNA